MVLSKEQKRVLKFLKKKGSSNYVNIDSLLGKGKKSYGQSDSFKNVIEDLEGENLIETRGGAYTNIDRSKGYHRTEYYNRLEERNFGSYQYEPLEAKITMKGLQVVGMNPEKKNLSLSAIGLVATIILACIGVYKFLDEYGFINQSLNTENIENVSNIENPIAPIENDSTSQ